MLFWLFLIVMVVGVLLLILDAYYLFENDWAINTGLTMVIIGCAVVLTSIIIISISYIGLDAKVEQYNARYESLVYQYENDIYDNDNDLGKRELIEDIRDWNEDLASRKENQDDLWIGIFIPDVYDQFDFIELGGK